jgi:hypothetical protein
MNLTTHNGCVTIISPRTGDHRTVRIRTQRSGERVVELLTGPDNFRAFGYFRAGGVELFRRHHGDRFFEWIAKWLKSPRGEYLFEGRCRKCNRRLTEPESIRCGLGPKCREDIDC